MIPIAKQVIGTFRVRRYVVKKLWIIGGGWFHTKSLIPFILNDNE